MDPNDPSSTPPSSSGNGPSVMSGPSSMAGGSSGMSGSNGSGQHGELLSRVVQGAHDTIDRLADSAAPHVQRLQQGMATASQSLQDRAGQARDMGDEWAETLRCSVRDNPLAAVAVALVAGVLIARLTQR